MGSVGSKKREYKIDSVDQISSVNETIEKVVCKSNDLKDGEMKEFEIGQGKIILVKENGTYSALGSKCTHYGAPLINGVLKNGIIRCPWHGACFSATTGDIEDYPGLDSLPCFEVTVINNDVKVKADVAALRNQKRIKPVVKHLATSFQTFVIVGGGAAAQSCAETLRQNGYTGKLIMISKEKHFPYDRPKLSKALDANPENLYLRNQEYYREADITFMSETEVTGIDVEQCWVSCDGGKLMVKYDSLMIATGGSPVALNVPGSTLKNICLLRTPEDGNYIAQNAAGKAVVIIGSSFIGIEVASYLLTKARSINVVSRSYVPFKVVFGEVIGNRIKKMFEEKGVVFHCNAEVTQFLGSKGSVTGVQLTTGEILEVDVCVVGIGVKPATDFLKNSGIAMNSRGIVSVNKYLETNIKGVYACGDIVEFPLTVFEGRKMNVCHWQMAMAHGHTAALNMLDKKQELRSVPFFWSVMCGKSFRYAGYGEAFDDVIIDGNIDQLEFVAYYCKNDVVIGICTINRDPVAASFASDVLGGKLLLKNEIGSG